MSTSLPPSLPRRVLALLRERPGLTDREVATALTAPYERVAITCRRLELRGLVSRDRSRTEIRNYPAAARPMAWAANDPTATVEVR